MRCHAGVIPHIDVGAYRSGAKVRIVGHRIDDHKVFPHLKNRERSGRITCPPQQPQCIYITSRQSDFEEWPAPIFIGEYIGFCRDPIGVILLKPAAARSYICTDNSRNSIRCLYERPNTCTDLRALPKPSRHLLQPISLVSIPIPLWRESPWESGSYDVINIILRKSRISVNE